MRELTRAEMQRVTGAFGLPSPDKFGSWGSPNPSDYPWGMIPLVPTIGLDDEHESDLSSLLDLEPAPQPEPVPEPVPDPVPVPEPEPEPEPVLPPEFKIPLVPVTPLPSPGLPPEWGTVIAGEAQLPSSTTGAPATSAVTAAEEDHCGGNDDQGGAEDDALNSTEDIKPNTWDKVTNDRIQDLHPAIQQDVNGLINQVYNALGVHLRVAYDGNFRTFEEQQNLYAIGRTVDTDKSIVTNAEGGESYHNYGLAFDLIITDERGSYDRSLNGDMSEWTKDRAYYGEYEHAQSIVDIAQELGFEWGGGWGNPPDLPHFQMTFDMDEADLKRIHDAMKDVRGNEFNLEEGLTGVSVNDLMAMRCLEDKELKEHIREKYGEDDTSEGNDREDDDFGGDDDDDHDAIGDESDDDYIDDSDDDDDDDLNIGVWCVSDEEWGDVDGDGVWEVIDDEEGDGEGEWVCTFWVEDEEEHREL